MAGFGFWIKCKALLKCMILPVFSDPFLQINKLPPGIKTLKTSVFYTVLFLGLSLNPISCSLVPPGGTKAPEPSPTGNADVSPSTIWIELLKKTPFPHTAPLPPQQPTILDGTYTQSIQSHIQPIRYRRNPVFLNANTC